MLELGQAQLRNGDEVSARSEPFGRSLGVLQQPVHGLNECVATSLLHARDHPFKVRPERARQPLEGLQATSHRPADPALQPFWDHIRAVTVLHHFGHLALRHLQAPGPSILQIRVLQGVHCLHMSIRPGTHGACASPSSGCDGWSD